MKKSFWKVFCIIAIIMMSIDFISCSKDDETTKKKYSDEINDKSDDEPSVSGSIGGHNYVDLGLSVKWATCNIGASTPEGYGSYFAWGETSDKNYYGIENYSYYDSQKYRCTSINNGEISMTHYDAAYVNWNSSWRMPNISELKELEEKCKAKWITYNGVNGQLFTAPNGNSIFFPATGLKIDEIIIDKGKNGYYWSSEIDHWVVNNKNDYNYAYCLGIADNYINTKDSEKRWYGLTIRAVYGTKNSSTGSGTSGGGGSSVGDAPYVTSFDFTATKTSITVKFMCNERPTSATVKYGTSSATSTISSNISGKQVSATATGLKAGTKYYFKCTVKNDNGSSTSDPYPAMTNY